MPERQCAAFQAGARAAGIAVTQIGVAREGRGLTLHDANGNRLTGLHTTVTPASGNNSSTRSTYDSFCNEHNPN